VAILRLAGPGSSPEHPDQPHPTLGSRHRSRLASTRPGKNPPRHTTEELMLNYAINMIADDEHEEDEDIRR